MLDCLFGFVSALDLFFGQGCPLSQQLLPFFFQLIRRASARDGCFGMDIPVPSVFFGKALFFGLFLPFLSPLWLLDGVESL